MIIKHLLGKILIAAIVLFLGWFAFVYFTSAKKGEQAPEIETVLNDGTPFKLSELQGNYVLLDFWGSWCGPCRQENRELVEFYQRNKDRILIVSVALERNDANWRGAKEADGLVWKHHIVEVSAVVLGSKIARDYGVTSIPMKFLIDPKGVIVDADSFEEMQAVLDAAN